LLDGAIRLTTAVFYYDWEDLQTLIAVSLGGGVTGQILTNAGDAEIWGWEGSIDWAPSDGWLFRGGAAYLNAEISKSNDISGSIAEGNELGNTPEWTLNGLGRYTTQVGSNFEAYGQLDFSWQSDVFFDTVNNPFLREDSYGLLNARFGLRSQDGGWEVAAWAKNLTDEDYRLYGLDVTASGLAVLVSGQPISYGVQVIFRTR